MRGELLIYVEKQVIRHTQVVRAATVLIALFTATSSASYAHRSDGVAAGAACSALPFSGFPQFWRTWVPS